LKKNLFTRQKISTVIVEQTSSNGENRENLRSKEMPFPNVFYKSIIYHKLLYNKQIQIQNTIVCSITNDYFFSTKRVEKNVIFLQIFFFI